MTTNTAQGITSTEHIFVTPRGAQTTDGRRSDVSDWRHRERDYWLTSEGAEKQEVVNRRPLGDPRPVGAADLWMNWAATSAELPEKLNATDLVREAGATRHRHLWPGWHAWSRAATQTPCDDNWSGAAFIAKPPQAGWFDAFVAGNRQVQHGVARLSTVAAAVHKAVAMQLAGARPLVERASAGVRQRFAAILRAETRRHENRRKDEERLKDWTMRAQSRGRRVRP